MLPPPPRIVCATDVAPNSSQSVQSGSRGFTRRLFLTCQRPGRKSKSVTGMTGHGRCQTGQNLPSMAKTERVLRLLEALQDRPFATGPELGARLEAREQTIGFTPTGHEPMPPSADALLLLADAARRCRRVHAVYTTSDGARSERELSPYGVVSHRGRWYAPAHDHGRDETRALRVDRFGTIRLGGAGRRPPPDFDAVAFVSRTLARVPWTHEVEVVLKTAAEAAAERFPPTLAELEPAGGDTLLRMRAESLDWVAGLLAGAGCDFTIRRPEELRASVRGLADRLRAA